MEIFVDGSFKKTDISQVACVGIYAVVDGVPETLKFNIPSTAPHLQARFEHYGVVEAILTYTRKFIEDVSGLTINIRTDCQRAYDLFSGSQKKFKSIDQELLAVFCNTKKFVENLAIEWIPRNQNRKADILANEARLTCEESFDSIPTATLFDTIILKV